MRKVHVLIAVEHDGSGDPVALAASYAEGFVLRCKEAVEKAAPSKKLLVLSVPIGDSDGNDVIQEWLQSVGDRRPGSKTPGLFASPHGG